MPDPPPAPSPRPRGRGGTYLLTWTTHGSWLPGDDRGFIGPVAGTEKNWERHNVLGTPRDAGPTGLSPAAIPPDGLKAVLLSSGAALICQESFERSALTYELALMAGAVMRTHVHLVVHSREREGAELLRLFKGAAARALTLGSQQTGRHWWTRHGSRRLLPDDAAIEGAVKYVLTQPSFLRMFGSRFFPPPSSAKHGRIEQASDG